MIKTKIVLLIAVAFVLVGCSAKYHSFQNSIDRAATPSTLVSLAKDINTSDLSSEQKQQLNIELVKRTLVLCQYYIKAFVSKENLPPKDEVVDMIKLLSSSLDDVLTDDMRKEVISTIKELRSSLLPF